MSFAEKMKLFQNSSESRAISWSGLSRTAVMANPLRALVIAAAIMQVALGSGLNVGQHVIIQINNENQRPAIVTLLPFREAVPLYQVAYDDGTGIIVKRDWLTPIQGEHINRNWKGQKVRVVWEDLFKGNAGILTESDVYRTVALASLTPIVDVEPSPKAETEEATASAVESSVESPKRQAPKPAATKLKSAFSVPSKRAAGHAERSVRWGADDVVPIPVRQPQNGSLDADSERCNGAVKRLGPLLSQIQAFLSQDNPTSAL